MKKLLLLAGGIAAALVVAALNSGTSTEAGHQPTTPAAAFNPSFISCLGASVPNPNSPLTTCSGAQNLLLGAAPSQQIATRLPGGTRQSLVFSYAGPGWRYPGNGLVAPADGTVVGGIKSRIDLFCDGSLDVFADTTSPGNPAIHALNDDTNFPYEQSRVRTTAWGVGTGPADQPDETFLDRVVPGPAITPRAYRLRAEADTVFLPGGISNPIEPNAPINFIGLTLPWSPGGDTLLTATFLAGGVAAPGTSKNCLDSPQNAITTQSAGSGISANPALAGTDVGGNGRDDNTGYYARWAVFVSAVDLVNGEIQGVIVNDCKYVSATAGGGSEVAAPAGSDSDGDCLEDSATAEPGRPTESTADDGTADRDGDGIVDGIEVAWGSSPTAADTDGDLRSDLEELLANGVNLSDPTDVDTDGDGVNDGGIGWDLDDNGVADDVVAAGTMESLMGGATGPAKVHASFRINGNTQRPFEGDNCTNIANGTQTNSDSGRPTTGDRTNADEDTTGDACETDSDNDGFNDLAEPSNNWISGFPASACRITGGGGYVAAATSATSRDSDNDRILDGAECQEGKNPASSTSQVPAGSCTGASGGGYSASDPPYIESCGSDADGMGIKTERIERSTSINQAEGAALSCGSGQLCNIDGGRAATAWNLAGDASNGEADLDSDADGMTDGREYHVWGTSPANMDSDGDGCTDGIEIISTDGDCAVGFGDFVNMLAKWNTNSLSATWGDTGGSPGGRAMDYDGSNSLGFADFVIVLQMWNKTLVSTCTAGNGCLEP